MQDVTSYGTSPKVTIKETSKWHNHTWEQASVLACLLVPKYGHNDANSVSRGGHNWYVLAKAKPKWVEKANRCNTLYYIA
jgi:hypothetical protein